MLILITNNTLANRAGTELYVRDLALGLLNRGHTPVAYSTRLGDVARELRANGVQVVDDLGLVTTQPDIIHGHHHLDTMTALLRFPGTPAIFVCHGSTPWEEEPPVFPTIGCYVAVDYACRDRLVIDHAIPEDRVQVTMNFVDLERFKIRGDLPNRPQRALVFSNRAHEGTHLPVIRSACERAGIQLDVVGAASGKVCIEPEAMLGNYDLVFAKGRSALEALAVGTAVVLCDAVGSGPMVTTDNFEHLRPLNFGLRALVKPLSAGVIAGEIATYDPRNAMAVTGLVRATAGRDAVIDSLLSLYRKVIDEHHQSVDRDVVGEQHAAAAYLRKLAPRLYQGDEAVGELEVIKNSRSWRLISRYSATREHLLLPARKVLKRLSQKSRSNEQSLSRGETETRSAKDVFSDIHRRRDWGSGESASGPGSSRERAAAFKDELLCLFKEFKAKSVLDAGCGDFNWMKDLELDFARYIGVDVVPELIAENQMAYGEGLRSFVCLDMTKDNLPNVDIILCRDSLVHLTLAEIFAALENFRQSGSTYLLTTTFTRWPGNADIRTGGWRQINLQIPPFNFPEPLRLIDEKCTHSGGVFIDKFLGFWALKDVPPAHQRLLKGSVRVS